MNTSEEKTSRLVLHSCAPSGSGYPDTRAEAMVGPVLFSPLRQGLVWRLVRRLVRSDSGLRTKMAQLSELECLHVMTLGLADDLLQGAYRRRRFLGKLHLGVGEPPWWKRQTRYVMPGRLPDDLTTGAIGEAEG